MTYDEYIATAMAYAEAHPEQRPGQVYFNVLVAHRPDLAERLRGTALDPFYARGRISSFLNEVATRWDSRGGITELEELLANAVHAADDAVRDNYREDALRFLHGRVDGIESAIEVLKRRVK